MIQLYRAPFSTNVERVLIALAIKSVEFESVTIDYADRSAVERVSGQPLVPVLVDDRAVVADSMRIIEHLEARFPDPPLYPGDPAKLAEMRVFIDWFNRVWKVAPNAIEAGADPVAPAAELASALDLFEGLLTDRDFLLGNRLSAADCAAYPFLKFAAHRPPEDDEPFHVILEEYQQLGDDHPRLAAWLARMLDRCRALGL